MKRKRVVKDAKHYTRFQALVDYAENIAKDPEYCKKCPLFKYPIVKPDYGIKYPDCRIMMVGEAPQEVEVQNNCTMSGASGAELNKSISEFGHRRNEVYLTDAVKCFLPPKEKIALVSKKRNPDDDDWMETLDGVSDYCSRLHLYKEIKLAKPKLIIALGETALRPVTGNRGIGKNRGRVFKSTHELLADKDQDVFATFHTAYIIRRRELSGALRSDLKAAFEHIFGSTKSPVTYSFPTKFKDVMAFIKELHNHKVIACDFETSGFSFKQDKVLYSAYDYRKGKILCASFSWKPNTSTVIPFYGYKAEPLWNIKERDTIRKALKECFESPDIKWVFHNWAFDVRFAHTTFGVDPVKMRFEDTMLMQFCIDENLPRGLKDLAHQYTDMGDYESEVLASQVVGNYSKEIKSMGKRKEMPDDKLDRGKDRSR